MTTVIANSALLSLTSLLLSSDDKYLPAGAHFRWAISPDMGFPYAGFRLRMRPAPTWPWPKDQIKMVFFSRNNIATSMAGVHISDAPIRVNSARVTNQYFLTCDENMSMRFCHEQREREDPLFAPWVRFAVMLRKRPGLKGRLPSTRTPIKTFTTINPTPVIKGEILNNTPNIKLRDNIWRIFEPKGGSGEKVHIKGLTKLAGEDVIVTEHRTYFDQLPHLNLGKLDERVAIISGNELHAVTLELDDGLEVIGIAYCTAQQAHDTTGWETIAWQQPLCKPGTADVAAPMDAKQLASERLKAMRPLRRPADPYFNPAAPPISQENHQSFEKSAIDDIYKMAQALTNAFRMEIDNKVPPGSVMVADVDEDTSASSDKGRMDFPFHGLLQTGAFADHVAAMLGLGFYKKFNANPTRKFDFEVEAIVPVMWLYIACMSPQMRKNIDLSRVPSSLITPGGKREVFDSPPIGFVRLVAFNINRNFSTSQPVLAPTISVQIVPDPSRLPVQARVSIEIFPQASNLRSLLWRDDGHSNGPVPIGPVDPVAKLLVPMLANPHGVCRAHDNDLVRYGTVKYLAINIDSFGRASEPEDISALVKDNSPPVAPGRPVIKPGYPSSLDPNRFPDVIATFDWTDAMMAASPDVVRFHLLWRRGSVDSATVEAQPDGRISIEWPVPPSQKIETFTGGIRIINDVDIRAQRSGQRHEWTMICLAEDAAGNVSVPSSPAHEVVIEPVMPPPPVQLPEPQWTAWPDAIGDARYRIHWTVPSGATGARISSASENRILKLAGVDRASHLRLSSSERASALKELAVNTPNAFVPEAPVYPATSTSHDIVLKADSRDYRVVIVEFMSQTGQKAPWPQLPAQKDVFAIIRARSSPILDAPIMRVERQNNRFFLSAITSETGTVEIFALTDPAQAKDVAIMNPVKVISTADEELVEHVPSLPAANPSRWVGYACRLLLDNKQKSPLSEIIWREVPSR